MCESERRDGGISLEIHGSGRPSAKPVRLSLSALLSLGSGVAAARELEPRRAGVVPEAALALFQSARKA